MILRSLLPALLFGYQGEDKAIGKLKGWDVVNEAVAAADLTDCR